MTPPFSETWPSLTGGSLISPSLRSLVRRRRPSANSFTLLNSFLAEGEADVCCCGFRCRLLSRTWWSRTCGLLRISPQCTAGAHTPRLRFTLFSRPGLTRLPVTQYSSVRSCCYPPSSQDNCLPPGAGAATASAACVQAVLLSAGFLRVLVTHCLLCEKRRVDLFQVREQRFSQPLWPSSSCSFVRSLEPRLRAVRKFN